LIVQKIPINGFEENTDKDNLNDKELADNPDDQNNKIDNKSDKKPKSKKILNERPATHSPSRNIIKEIKIPSGYKSSKMTNK